jgi:CRISPR-associated protein Cmr4
MNSAMLGLLAETSIHPGAGRSLGVVDLPVAREAANGYPVIVGSSLKGSLRELAEERSADDNTVRDVFGTPDKAGDVLVSDARLLLLPVRGLASASVWVTCPHLIERFRRDLTRAGIGPCPPAQSVADGQALAAGKTDAPGDRHLFLEERSFERCGEPDGALAEAIRPLMRHDEVHDRLRRRLVVLSDNDFAWFSEFGLPVQARNVLEDGTKRSKNLWYEETLPPDTVMYALLLGRTNEALGTVQRLFDKDCYLQLGGNATVGQGWFAVTVREGGGK